MAEINPKRIMQTDISQDVSADGVPLQQTAAPSSATVRQSAPISAPAKEVSIADLPVVTDDIPATTDNESVVETPAVDEKPTVDFTDFLKASADIKVVPDAPKKEEVQPKVDTQNKEEPAAEEPIVVAQVKSGDKPTTPQPRDLSDIPQEYAPAFERMSNAAFNTLKPVIKEYPLLKQKVTELEADIEKRKKGGIPDSYYEHPQGFVLTPEFSNASQRVNLSQQIFNHWQQQFSKIREGAAEFDNLGQDSNGNLVITGKVKADTSAEATILGFINSTQQQLFKEQGKLEALSITHKDKHQQAISWLNQHEKQAFSIFDTPGGQQYLPQVNEIVKNYPAALQANPLARVLAKSELVNFHLAQMLKNAGGPVGGNGVATNKPAANPQQQRLQAIRRSAGPTNGDMGGDTTNKNGKSEVTMDEFEAVKNGL